MASHMAYHSFLYLLSFAIQAHWRYSLNLTPRTEVNMISLQVLT